MQGNRSVTGTLMGQLSCGGQIRFVLFAIQSRCTGQITKASGPVMLLWFAAIAVFGIAGVTRHGRRIPPCLPELGFHIADNPDRSGVKTVTRPQKSLWVKNISLRDRRSILCRDDRSCLPAICRSLLGLLVKMAKKIPIVVQPAGARQLADHVLGFDDVDEHSFAVGQSRLVDQFRHESDGTHFSYEGRIEADLLHAVHDRVRGAGNLRPLCRRQVDHDNVARLAFVDERKNDRASREPPSQYTSPSISTECIRRGRHVEARTWFGPISSDLKTLTFPVRTLVAQRRA